MGNGGGAVLYPFRGELGGLHLMQRRLGRVSQASSAPSAMSSDFQTCPFANTIVNTTASQRLQRVFDDDGLEY